MSERTITASRSGLDCHIPMGPILRKNASARALEASPTDRAMIALDRRTSVTHHLVTRFFGELDESLLATVWRSLGDRHPILRSSLSPADHLWRRVDRQLGFAVLRADDADTEDEVLQALCASRLASDPVESGRL